MIQLNRELEQSIRGALQAAQADNILPAFEIPKIPVSAPKRSGQGDLSYPAMGLARHARMKPLDIANLIVEQMSTPDFIESVEVAPPGFINFTLSESYLRRQVDAIIAERDKFFQLDIGEGKKAQVEFVSANPSGPITIGHTRNAVVGDAMARLLEAAGYDVQREYYYNNAGNQMIVLGKSLMLRYLQQLGEDIVFPADYYQGGYLMEVAADLVQEHGDALRNENWEVFKDIAESRMFAWINRSLSSIDIKHDDFYNETSLFETGRIWQVLDAMRENGHIYESTHWEGADDAEIVDTIEKSYEQATWFRSTTFGDEKDRVMVKSDGVPTYTLPDIAYHCHKLERSFDIAVNVLGTDHFSQASVVQYGIRALNMCPDPIHVIFLQMVRAVRWDEARGEYAAIKQSKRAGDFDTLDDLVEMTSADAVRYHMLARSPNSQLDFDVDQVVKQSNENPVYYIQNAYVRCAGIFREAEERGFDDDGADLSLLGDAELRFIRKTLELGNVIEQAVTNYEPHKIAFFAQELASVYHPIYDQVRVLHSEVPADIAKARLRFYRAAGVVFHRLLRLMGMTAPERM
ncbi:MAG: arginine--tRNA ligase [Chloroflexi bacterium]|nr:arginine--tRNA ligase [Chloroflexota bacterium]